MTIDPVSGAVAPVAAPIADCCTVGGFPVSALDGGAGTLASSPSLPAGYNYNRFELAVAP